MIFFLIQLVNFIMSQENNVCVFAHAHTYAQAFLKVMLTLDTLKRNHQIIIRSLSIEKSYLL